MHIHHLNTHTYTGNKELVMTGTLRYAQTPTNQPKAKKKSSSSLPATFIPKSPHTSSFEQKRTNCSTNHPEVNRPLSLVTERVIRRHALQSGTDTHFHVLGPPHSFSFSTLNWPRLGAGQVETSDLRTSQDKASLSHLRTQQPLRPGGHGEKNKNATQSHSASAAGRKPLATLCKPCVGTSLIATHHRIWERNRRRPTGSD